jgi:hypothetical protein
MTTEDLNRKYPEGIPSWMTARGMTPDEIDAMMQLRRKAFPQTTPLRGNMQVANATQRDRIYKARNQRAGRN